MSAIEICALAQTIVVYQLSRSLQSEGIVLSMLLIDCSVEVGYDTICNILVYLGW